METAEQTVGVILALWCIVGWGLWPTLRTRSNLPTPAFALLNVSTQWVCALVWGVAFGSSSVENFAWLTPTFSSQIAPSSSSSSMRTTTTTASYSADASSFAAALCTLAAHPTSRDGAVFLGGVLVGHGDHLSALAMRRLPGGVVYQLYAGVVVGLGGLLNYALVQPARPALMFCGFSAILGAIFALAVAERAYGREARSEALERLEASIQSDEAVGARAASGVYVRFEEPRNSRAALTAYSHGDSSSGHISPRTALAITLGGALCASLWSPLATWGSVSGAEAEPHIRLVVFASGQLCALPSIAALAHAVERSGAVSPCAALCWCAGWRAIGYGLACGLSIASGFVAFFVAARLVTPPVLFGVAHCAPLAALLIDLHDGAFRGATHDVHTALAACAALYVAGIGALVASNG